MITEIGWIIYLAIGFVFGIKDIKKLRTWKCFYDMTGRNILWWTLNVMIWTVGWPIIIMVRNYNDKKKEA